MTGTENPMRPTWPPRLTPDEIETVERALASGYLRADHQRVAVLAEFRRRCREHQRPAIFVLAKRAFAEGADVRAVEGLALEIIGCRVKSVRGRLVVSGPDPDSIAAELAGLFKREGTR